MATTVNRRERQPSGAPCHPCGIGLCVVRMRGYHPIAQRPGDELLLAVPSELQRHALVANLNIQGMSAVIVKQKRKQGRTYPIAYPVDIASVHQHAYIPLEELFDVVMRGKNSI
jgi:hypothetical protein